MNLAELMWRYGCDRSYNRHFKEYSVRLDDKWADIPLDAENDCPDFGRAVISDWWGGLPLAEAFEYGETIDDA